MQRDSDRGKFPTTIIILAAVAIAVATILTAVFAYLSSTNPNYGYNGYNGGYGGMMGGYGGFSWLFMMPIGLIVLVVIGYVIWRGFEGGDHTGHSGAYDQRGNAMEILRQRYARGEISKDQYEQMKRDIMA